MFDFSVRFDYNDFAIVGSDGNLIIFDPSMASNSL
jgi:hypothetical protein